MTFESLLVVPPNAHELAPYRGWRLFLEYEADLVRGHALGGPKPLRFTTLAETAEEVKELLREFVDEEEGEAEQRLDSRV